MTDKEVRKLKRAELMEILFYLQKEMETLKEENANLRRQLESVTSAKGITDADMERLVTAVKEAVRSASAAPDTAGE